MEFPGLNASFPSWILTIRSICSQAITVIMHTCMLLGHHVGGKIVFGKMFSDVHMFINTSNSTVL